tara:strand:- start:251 stop:541 length:291 start_codon:yes stop_codon:yes gene_type:complete
MEINFKVICVDAANRPNEIPTSKWVEKDEPYTVIKAEYMNIQNGLLGFELAELDISGCFPYVNFASNRFRPYTKDDEAAMEAVKDLLLEIDVEEYA